MVKNGALTIEESVDGLIYLLHGQRVMFDADLAVLYGVSTKVLNQAVKRNIERFPSDFMFQVNEEDFSKFLRSQFVTSKLPNGRGGRRYLPFVFTEQGVAMLSSVLRNSRAAKVNVEIMRAFVRLRRMVAVHADLARKLGELENKYDTQFKIVFDAIRQMMIPPETKRRKIGFDLG